MKKTFLLIVASIFALSTVNAQIFSQGDKVLNFGIGLGSTLYVGSSYKTKVPPISASLEFGIIDNMFGVDGLNLGVGGYFGFSKHEYRYHSNYWGTSSNYGWDYTNLIFGGRGVVHYQFVDKLDTYTGLLLGANIVSSKEYGTHTSSSESEEESGLAYSYFIGARYYLTDSFAGMAEIGYGIAYLNLGIAFKF